jgi:short-chain 2-methylacyl-CoA dehydrogenase
MTMTERKPSRRKSSATSQAARIDVPWCISEEQRAWRAAMATFADEIVAPVAAENYIDGRFPAELMSELGKLGVFGIRASPRYGGSGAGMTDLAIALEQLARVDGSTAGTVDVQAINIACLEAIGTQDQVSDILPQAIRGETFIAFGLTEPSGGSDARSMRTVARRSGDDWIISGAKQFITNGGTPFTQWVILFAVTGGRPGTSKPEISAFLVPLNAKGVQVGPSYPKMGFRSSDTRQLFFDEVRVPARAMLGKPGTGFAAAMNALSWARIAIGALATGMAQGCLDETIAFVGERESFGVKLADHQYVAFACAELAAITATCRMLTYDGCWKADHGLPYEAEASVIKYMTSELVNKATFLGTQLHGGQGYMLDSRIARLHLDARLLTIIEGTSEIHRLLIARQLGL